MAEDADPSPVPALLSGRTGHGRKRGGREGASASPPTASNHHVARTMASQRRSTRAGSVIRVECHCHPPPLIFLNPCSIQARNPYPQAGHGVWHPPNPSGLYPCRPIGAKAIKRRGGSSPICPRRPPTPLPPAPHGGNPVSQRVAVIPACGPERAAGIDAHQRMPAEVLDALEQPLGVQAPLGEDDQRPGRRHPRAIALRVVINLT